jgi:ribonuclease BN (tRNA processing enzyme)
MQLRVLGAFGGEGIGQRPSAFLVDDHLLVDAGTVGGSLSVPEQVEVDHAVISHAHLDHMVGLAFLTDTLAMCAPERSLTACSIAPVVNDLSAHAFNDRLWPDFRQIPSTVDPVLRLRVLDEGAEARLGKHWVTPALVDHTVPAAGFVVRNHDTGFVYTGDTGPTERLWKAARDMRGLKALVVETAFPNRFDRLARASGHLTPAMLRREIDKMPADVPIWIFHVKPQLAEEVAYELGQIDPARIRILEQGKTYSL